jgi:hypothetical protein
VHGNLGIKDHILMNLAMGAKLLWHLITGKYDWSKKILHEKYFIGTRKRCLEAIPKTREGSPI